MKNVHFFILSSYTKHDAGSIMNISGKYLWNCLLVLYVRVNSELLQPIDQKRNISRRMLCCVLGWRNYVIVTTSPCCPVKEVRLFGGKNHWMRCDYFVPLCYCSQNECFVLLFFSAVYNLPLDWLFFDIFIL